jgi:protein TonB
MSQAKAAPPVHAGIGVSLALHALAVAALVAYEPARKSLLAAAPIMVELLAAAPADAPRAKTPIAPARRPAAAPMERLATPASADAPATMPAAPAQAVAPSASPSPARIQDSAAAEPALSQPIFQADYLDNPAPAYPALSRRLGEQGRVLLRVLVNAKGRAEEVELRTPSGHARLDEAARDTVRRWRFVPARRGAEAVAAWVLIPISFRLDN